MTSQQPKGISGPDSFRSAHPFARDRRALDRKRRLDAFLQVKCEAFPKVCIADVARAAATDLSDFYKWKAGHRLFPDGCKVDQRITDVFAGRRTFSVRRSVKA